ncbi:MAG: hypothetical protein GY765_39135, partial [bacterium]|nr:hypothetical protein [bacterium]
KYLCAYYVNLPTTCPELWPSVAEFFIYDELLYYAMTHDERRNDSYKAAIRQLVKDKIVVEIGTGQDAILSRFCVEAGVKQVYALEMLDESYQKAKKKIKSLGMEDKITLIHGDATKIELPEKADVLLHEIVGSIGGSEGCTVILNNTRHFLKENAVMIPTKTITKMAAMYLPPELHANPRFAGVPGKYTEKVFNSFGFPFDLRLCIRNFPNENIISNDDLFEDLDYSGPCPGPVPPETTEPIHFVINKKAKMDGFAIWLTLETIQGEVIDILEHEYCWLPMYAPVFYPGVEVNPGDEVVGTCKRYLCENGINPSFTLEGLLKRKGKADVAFCYDMPHFEKRFREHPFYKKVFAEDWQSHIEDFSAGPGADGLREYLGRHLPAYMVPPHFVPLETLPLTANGKIDMNALPEPDTGGVDRQYEPPRTSTEKLLVDIWEQVLGVESAGIGDDFFQLGGDSIKAIR